MELTKPMLGSGVRPTVRWLGALLAVLGLAAVSPYSAGQEEPSAPEAAETPAAEGRQAPGGAAQGPFTNRSDSERRPFTNRSDAEDPATESSEAAAQGQGGASEGQAGASEKQGGAAATGSGGEINDVFIPSEEIAADEEVVFPVDI